FFFSSRRRHTRFSRDWSSDVCSSDLNRNDIANNKQGRFGYLYLGTKANASLFKKKLRISVGIEWLDLRRDYHYYGKTADLKDGSKYWLPNASLTYKGVRLSYNKQASLPSFFQLVAVDSDLYPTSFTVASPYFDNQETENFSMRYYKSFNGIKLNLNASVNYAISSNSIGTRRTYDVSNSQSTFERYQAPGSDRLWSNIHLMKRFMPSKIWNVSVTVSGYGSSNSSFSIVNGEENETKRLSGNITNTVNVTYKNKVTVIPTYGIRVNSSRNSKRSVNFRDMTNVYHDIGAVFRLDDIQRYRLETAYTLKSQ